MHLAFSQKNLLQYAALTTRSYGASAIKPWKKNPILKGSNPGKLPTAQDARRLQISKTMSYLLRHSKSECIDMRSDGFVPVNSLLSHPSMRGVSFSTVETVAKKDDKKRFALSYEPRVVGSSGQMESWWIRANQGHSLPVQVEMKRIIRGSEIPMAVHGTTEHAWRSISTNGLSKMNRNHIHMAQGLDVDGVVSGIRKNSRVLIYIDIDRALANGIPFYLSQNGVVLSPGNELGLLEPKFFQRVERVSKRTEEIWQSIT